MRDCVAAIPSTEYCETLISPITNYRASISRGCTANGLNINETLARETNDAMNCVARFADQLLHENILPHVANHSAVYAEVEKMFFLFLFVFALFLDIIVFL